MTASEFGTDTAVRETEGGWGGQVVERWNVGNNPNGGYTLAIAARAMLAASGRPDPLSITAHYVRPPEAGPVLVTTETVRAGRRYATVAARLVQGGREAVRLIGAFGDLAAQEGPTRIGVAMPGAPPPDACLSMQVLSEAAGAPVPEVVRRYDLRLDPDCQWVRSRCGPAVPDVTAGGRVEGPLEIRGWIRFSDRTEPSVVGLLAMVDAFPPTVLGSVDVGWVPTVELTAHVRGRPAPGWILGVFRTSYLLDGLLEQDGELWDQEGRLVAMGRQLAIALPTRR